ncbi:hypothetical protein IJI55_00885 [Candidatus Saccharibacteria bacterium]|nr:hypothetical protein [Candidatus Saccharibacteria bacterium]
MQFGKIITRKYDKNGNYNEIEQNIVEGIVNSPVSKTIEERVKVRNKQEELEEYQKFSDFVKNHPDIVRPAFRLETSRTGKKEGYYFVVKCYTKLERFEKV